MSDNIKTMTQATERLNELGCKGKHVFKNLADAKKAVANAEARRAGKPLLQSPATKPIAPQSPAGVPKSPIKNRESLLSAIEAEKQPGAKPRAQRRRPG
jgi:hypothetical protein